MKKKLNLKKEIVALLDGMNEVRGGGGTVIVTSRSNCNPICPSEMGISCQSECCKPILSKLTDCECPTDVTCFCDYTRGTLDCPTHKLYDIACYRPGFDPVE